MSLPPGPRLPAPLQSLLLYTRPVPWVESCRRRFGDMVTLHDSILGEMVYVSDSEVIQSIFRADPGKFRGGDRALEALVGRTSLLMLDGEPHLRMRRLLTPAFHGEHVKRYMELIAEITTREVQGWPVGKPFPLAHSAQSITLDVILRAVFGLREGKRRSELRQLLRGLVEMNPAMFAGILFPAFRRDLGRWSPWGRFVRLRAAVDELLYEEIRLRRSEATEGAQGDVLSMLLAARDEDGNGLTDEELRDELITMLIVGHETTGTGVAWTFERLLRHPSVMERLREELDAGEDAYLDAVIKESLRVRPVAMSTPRKLTEDMEVNGYRLPAETLLLLSIALVHFSPELYPDPHEFRPERFLDHDPEPGAWIPFGGGVRRCIGASLALAEMKVAISTIIKLVELKAPAMTPERIAFRGPTLRPSKGGRVVVTRHLAPGAPAAG